MRTMAMLPKTVSVPRRILTKPNNLRVWLQDAGLRYSESAGPARKLPYFRPSLQTRYLLLLLTISMGPVSARGTGQSYFAVMQNCFGPAGKQAQPLLTLNRGGECGLRAKHPTLFQADGALLEGCLCRGRHPEGSDACAASFLGPGVSAGQRSVVIGENPGRVHVCGRARGRRCSERRRLA